MTFALLPESAFQARHLVVLCHEHLLIRLGVFISTDMMPKSYSTILKFSYYLCAARAWLRSLESPPNQATDGNKAPQCGALFMQAATNGHHGVIEMTL